MESHLIIGVHITDRLEEAVEVQKLFTCYGGFIKTRLGLHETTGTTVGSKNGLILLEMVGPTDKCLQLAEQLNKIKGVEAQSMTFGHPTPNR